jgi:hypothetical protein
MNFNDNQIFILHFGELFFATNLNWFANILNIIQTLVHFEPVCANLQKALNHIKLRV